VNVLPGGKTEDLIASVVLRPGAPRSHEIFDAITRRHTVRMPFSSRRLPQALVNRLRLDARARSVELKALDGDDKAAIVALIARGDVIQLGDRAFRRELAGWLRANRSSARDGMRGYAHGFGDLLSRAGPTFIRTFNVGKSQGAKDRRLALESPALLFLGTPGDATTEWVATGRALMRVLLRLTSAGASASFLNQPIEVDSLRQELADTVGTTFTPQILLRAGFGPEIKPQPRRDLEDVIEIRRKAWTSRSNH
jgi:hypothetical protein